MGLFICQTHGRTGIILACPHLTQNVEDKVKFKNVLTFSTEEFGEDLLFRYCPACVAEYDLPAQGGQLSVEKFEAVS